MGGSKPDDLGGQTHQAHDLAAVSDSLPEKMQSLCKRYMRAPGIENLHCQSSIEPGACVNAAGLGIREAINCASMINTGHAAAGYILTEECQSIVQADLDTVYDLASLNAPSSSSALMLHGVFLSVAVLEASHESALLMMGRL